MDEEPCPAPALHSPVVKLQSPWLTRKNPGACLHLFTDSGTSELHGKTTWERCGHPVVHIILGCPTQSRP